MLPLLPALTAALVAAAPAVLAQAPSLSKQTVVPRSDVALWDVAVTDSGDILYSQTCRGLAIRINQTNGEYTDPILLFGDPKYDPTLNAPDFFCENQSGGHGVAIDPQFSRNRYVYFYMPSDMSNRGRRWNHVVRLKTAANMRSVSDRTDIIDDIFYKDEGNGAGSAGAHSGGRIRFGPDGFLYVTTGDNHNATLPQDLQALGGKVLRVTRDGDAAPDNDPPRGADPRIYAYGFRNVQARHAPVSLSRRRGTGTRIVREHPLPAISAKCLQVRCNCGAASTMDASLRRHGIGTDLHHCLHIRQRSSSMSITLCSSAARSFEQCMQGIAFQPGTGTVFIAEHGPEYDGAQPSRV